MKTTQDIKLIRIRLATAEKDYKEGQHGKRNVAIHTSVVMRSGRACAGEARPASASSDRRGGGVGNDRCAGETSAHRGRSDSDAARGTETER